MAKPSYAPRSVPTLTGPGPAEPRSNLTSHVTRVTPIIHANATLPEAVWREPDHTQHGQHDNQTVDLWKQPAL